MLVLGLQALCYNSLHMIDQRPEKVKAPKSLQLALEFGICTIAQKLKLLKCNEKSHPLLRRKQDPAASTPIHYVNAAYKLLNLSGLSFPL